MLWRSVCLLHLLTVMEIGYSFKTPTFVEENKIQRTAECNVCAESEDCSGANTVCVNGRCSCDYGYSLDGDRCEPESVNGGTLGAPCSLVDVCRTPNSWCAGDTCACHRTFVRVYDRCLPKKNHNETCEHRGQCGELQYCSCDGRCSCITGYAFDEYITQSCLEISTRDGPCKITAQCDYANGQCNGGVCGCSTYTGRSIDNNDCVAKNMDFSVTMELKNVYYTPRLNDPAYRNLLVDLNATKRAVIFNIETSGIIVESFNLHSISRNPLSGKADVTFSLTVYNPEYKRLSMGKTLGPARKKRSINRVDEEERDFAPEDSGGANRRGIYSMTAEVIKMATENIEDTITTVLTLRQ